MIRGDGRAPPNPAVRAPREGPSAPLAALRQPSPGALDARLSAVREGLLRRLHGQGPGGRDLRRVRRPVCHQRAVRPEAGHRHPACALDDGGHRPHRPLSVPRSPRLRGARRVPWVFGFVNGYLAHGVLVLYAFHALTRVSNGDLQSFLPDIADITQILRPARLALAAFVISSAPLIAVTLLVPGADLSDIQGGHAREPSPAPEPPVAAADPEDAEPDEEEAAAALVQEPSLRASGVALLAVTFLWMLVYTPVALTVAALSHSYLSTLNPVIGIDVIRRMGATYWHAMAIYSVLAFAQWRSVTGSTTFPSRARSCARSPTPMPGWPSPVRWASPCSRRPKDLGWD